MRGVWWTEHYGLDCRKSTTKYVIYDKILSYRRVYLWPLDYMEGLILIEYEAKNCSISVQMLSVRNRKDMVIDWF